MTDEGKKDAPRGVDPSGRAPEGAPERPGRPSVSPGGRPRARGRANDPILGLPTEAKPLRIALYVLTFASAVAALFLEQPIAGAVARGALSPLWLFTALGVYGVFFLAYAVDRALLVKRRRYPAGKAFFQVIFGLLFGLLLLPSTIRDYSASVPDGGLERLLAHPDPEVRVVSVEALGYRGFAAEHVALLVKRLSDRDPRVVEAARGVLGRWSGRSPEDAAGIEAWASALSETATVSRGEGTR